MDEVLHPRGMNPKSQKQVIALMKSAPMIAQFDFIKLKLNLSGPGSLSYRISLLILQYLVS